MKDRQQHFFAAAEAGRLDAILTGLLSGVQPVSRSQIKKLIEQGQVTVNGQAATKSGQEIEVEDEITISLASDESPELPAWDFPLDVIYEDEDLAVVNKPAGMSVHPGAGEAKRTLANALVFRWGSQLPGEKHRPGIVHRIDKDTTGLLVVARTAAAHAALAEQFQTKSAGRVYTALVISSPRDSWFGDGAGRIDQPIGRDPKDRKKMAVVKDGRSAITTWKLAERFNSAAILDLTLETGRTHQIRVHLAHEKHSIIGDSVYGDFAILSPRLRAMSEQFGRQALHAHTLTLTHPVTGKEMTFHAPLPDDLDRLISIFREQKQ